MRSVTYTAVILALAFDGLVALGQSYDFGPAAVVSRAATAKLTVTQSLPPRDDGSTPYREEIRDLAANKHKWDLFILALSSLMSVSQDDASSYYQIAGIHGAPFQPYNGVTAFGRNVQSGYCMHNSVLFPTWHRPYLSLFETRMYALANTIAAQFGDDEADEYQKAAAEFRVPYWDWSSYAPAGESHFPDVFWNAKISQYGPNGLQTIKNPLYSYQFRPLDSRALSISPLNRWPETKRSPDTRYSDPPSDNSQVSSAMYRRTPQIQQRLYNMYSSYNDYQSFSNKAWATENNRYADSIESLHDLVHTYTGLGGHMAYIPIAAFDPLFFLHHANVDRLVAIWQVLNNDSWISPMRAEEQTFAAPRGTWQDGSTPLYPFAASDNGDMWTSDMARSTESFGYTYADTDAQAGDLRASLIRKINQWYGGHSPANMKVSRVRHRAPDSMPHANGSAAIFNVAPGAKAPAISKVVENNQYTEWTARIIVNVEALDGVLGIHLFMGEPPANAADWETAAHLVGTAAIPGMGSSTGSAARVSSVIPLTSSLMKLVAAGQVPSLDPESVVPFLKRNLRFSALDRHNNMANETMMSGLQIGIDSASVRMPASAEELPQWGTTVTRIDLLE
ncbi:hypothetical protein LLEC1_07414 [Akanthomyces lecanii]|uniref:tyrosinase n=1 Tax=Cordyceps confragosa TaxID=2714763 RepID=A0A179IMT0_CORDF|nr:hypothetical protein LLEC1_07414 [Akanthomyces lecanii]